jgi:hypothetical protein
VAIPAVPATLWIGVDANQWYFAKIEGVWYGGAGEWLYRGPVTCKAGQGTRRSVRTTGWELAAIRAPKVGELVGYMASSVALNGPVQRTVDHHSNINVQPWRDTSLGSTSLRAKP